METLGHWKDAQSASGFCRVRNARGWLDKSWLQGGAPSPSLESVQLHLKDEVRNVLASQRKKRGGENGNSFPPGSFLGLTLTLALTLT